MSDGEVLVIGAGPAGCSAAIFCAQNDMKVTLIELENELSYRPGESLHPGVLSLLQQLGTSKKFLSAGFLTYSGNWVRWEDDTCHFQSFGMDESEEWRGFQTSRPDFDQILQERAKELGVRIIQSCKAIDPLISRHRVAGVRTAEGNFKSTFLVDSTGGAHWLARRMNLSFCKYSPKLIAYYGYVRGQCHTRDTAPLISADKEGWIWTARIKPLVYQWIRLFFNIQTIGPSFIPPEFSGLGKMFTRGSDVTWRIVRQTAGKGYFMIGDSAFVLDPLSSHGIIKAIMSGMMAGYLISKIVNKRYPEETAISFYNDWISSWFYNDLDILRDLYSKHPCPPDWI